MIISQIAIVGCGLIGGSLALAWRAAGMEIVLVDSDEAARAEATAQGFTVFADPAEAVASTEIIVLAAPLPVLESLMRRIAPSLPRGAIVTDVGSVKQSVVAQAQGALPGIAFVPGHPIAGSEKTGMAAARADLFAGKKVILTPEDPARLEVARVADLWRQAGAKPDYMPAELHDRIYAAVSHLPQYIAFKNKELFEDHHVLPGEDEPLARFRRLEFSSPALWRGIFEANKTNLSNCLHQYLEALRQIIAELDEGQEEAAPADPALVYGTLFPAIAASCLVSVTARLERELGVPLKAYTGTGFADFTAPLAACPPEEAMERISAQAPAIAALLADFASRLARDLPS